MEPSSSGSWPPLAQSPTRQASLTSNPVARLRLRLADEYKIEPPVRLRRRGWEGRLGVTQPRSGSPCRVASGPAMRLPRRFPYPCT
jgi:hypothetical protein